MMCLHPVPMAVHMVCSNSPSTEAWPGHDQHNWEEKESQTTGLFVVVWGLFFFCLFVVGFCLFFLFCFCFFFFGSCILSFLSLIPFKTKRLALNILKEFFIFLLIGRLIVGVVWDFVELCTVGLRRDKCAGGTFSIICLSSGCISLSILCPVCAVFLLESQCMAVLQQDHPVFTHAPAGRPYRCLSRRCQNYLSNSSV